MLGYLGLKWFKNEMSGFIKNEIFEKNTEKNRWRSIVLGPICPPVAISTRIYPQDLRTPKNGTKKTQGGGRGRDRPRSAGSVGV